MFVFDKALLKEQDAIQEVLFSGEQIRTEFIVFILRLTNQG